MVVPYESTWMCIFFKSKFLNNFNSRTYSYTLVYGPTGRKNPCVFVFLFFRRLTRTVQTCKRISECSNQRSIFLLSCFIHFSFSTKHFDYSILRIWDCCVSVLPTFHTSIYPPDLSILRTSTSLLGLRDIGNDRIRM